MSARSPEPEVSAHSRIEDTFTLMYSYAPISLIIALPSHVTAGGITRGGWAGGVAGLLDLTEIRPAKGRPGHV
jgi:hypothetical protein